MSIVPAKECVSTMVRFRHDLHARLKAQAAKNGRSMNTEVNSIIENGLHSKSGGSDSGRLSNLLKAASLATNAARELLEQRQRIAKVLRDGEGALRQSRLIMLGMASKSEDEGELHDASMYCDAAKDIKALLDAMDELAGAI